MKQKIQPMTLDNLIDAVCSEYISCTEKVIEGMFDPQFLRGKIAAYRDVLSMLGKNNISLSIREGEVNK